MKKPDSQLWTWISFAVLTIVVITVVALFIFADNPDPEHHENDQDLASIFLPESQSEKVLPPNTELPNLETLPEDPAIKSARESLMLRFSEDFTAKCDLPLEYNSLVHSYDPDNPKSFSQSGFMELNSSTIPKIHKVATFGNALLSAYAKDTTKFGYLRIVEDLISQVYNYLKDVKFSVKAPFSNHYWQDYSILLARMLATYEFLGTNNEIKSKCDLLISRITPVWFRSLDVPRNGVELIQTAVPFLISNALYHPSQFKSKLAVPGTYNTLKVVLEAKLKTRDDNSDGFNVDRSYIWNQVATFLPLVSSGEFYSGALRTLNTEMSLDFSTNLENLTKEILDEILHPDLDVVPFGLFGPDVVSITPILTYQWPHYTRQSKPGVRIFPAVGLGVFKTSEFVFFVRVQRKGIAAYQSDDFHKEFAAGWIQMRKMFFKGKEYMLKYSWIELKNQPGVVSIDDDAFENFETPGGQVRTFFTDDVDSHIGFFDVGGLVLYWRNKYKFRESFFDEFGVCTANGLVVRLEVDNKTDKTLKVVTKDPDMPETMICYPKEVVEISANREATVRWYQVFNADVEPKEIKKNVEGNMTFKFGSSDYTIELQDDSHFVLKSGTPILAGSPKIAKPKKLARFYNGETLIFEMDDKFMFCPKA